MVLLVDQHRDMLDVAESTAAEVESRQLAMHYARALRASVPGWEASYLAATGPEIGVRETRRLAGTDLVTADDVLAGRRRPADVVARGGWPMEYHAEPGRTSYGGIRDRGWFDIPYGAMTTADRPNLWAAGRLVSSDERAFSSARVMGTAFAIGHAAGVAAALVSEGNGAVRVDEMQWILRDQGALL
jgi:hypothetical protein